MLVILLSSYENSSKWWILRLAEQRNGEYFAQLEVRLHPLNHKSRFICQRLVSSNIMNIPGLLVMLWSKALVGTSINPGKILHIIQAFSLLLLQSFVSSALESDGILDNHIRMHSQMRAFLLVSSAHDLQDRCSGPY